MFAAADLRVLSYNVRYPNPEDGANRWESRRDLFIDSIRSVRADIIGTQELFELQGNHLVEKLPAFAWFGLSRRGNHEDEHMGVFYRKDTVRLFESGNFWLSPTPDKPGSVSWNMSLPRMVTWGLFEDTRARKQFYFVNTHFPHRREDEEARTKCAEVLAAWLTGLPKDIPVILTGDFNTSPTSDAYRMLTKHLKDARVGLKDPAGEIGTFHGFSGQPRADRIDWILYRGALQPRSFETVLFHEKERYPSDHFPVLAEFRWN